jgi:hypothetical protein
MRYLSLVAFVAGNEGTSFFLGKSLNAASLVSVAIEGPFFRKKSARKTRGPCNHVVNKPNFFL